MALRPNRKNESHRIRHPRASGGPRPKEVDSRFRGNDTTIDGGEQSIIGNPLLTLRPDGAVLKVLLLPDRYDFLQPVDRELAGAKGGTPMSGGDDNRHTGLTNF